MWVAPGTRRLVGLKHAGHLAKSQCKRTRSQPGRERRTRITSERRRSSAWQNEEWTTWKKRGEERQREEREEEAKVVLEQEQDGRQAPRYEYFDRPIVTPWLPGCYLLPPRLGSRLIRRFLVTCRLFFPEPLGGASSSPLRGSPHLHSLNPSCARYDESEWISVVGITRVTEGLSTFDL